MPPHARLVPLTGRLLVVLTNEAVASIAVHALSPQATDLSTLLEVAQLGYPDLQDVLHSPVFASLPSRRGIRKLSILQVLSLGEAALQGPFPPSRSLAAYYLIDPGGLEPTSTQLIQALLATTPVEAVYREQAVGPPPAFSDNDYAMMQDHLDPAPAGIDAKWVWLLGYDGAGIDFVDIEMGWNTNHDDLKGKVTAALLDPAYQFNLQYRHHGTAVLGIVAGIDNDVGIIGIAPGINSVRIASHWDGSTEENVADAIATAADALAPGDVLLLETQGGGNWPIERMNGDFELNAIKNATSKVVAGNPTKGIIVIEPAGNAGEDLDQMFVWGNDSGAIMVGASLGDPPEVGTVPHGRLDSSNFGSRVNCFATGVGLVTTGYGDLGGSANEDQYYTKGFTATSGASAVLAGAAVLAQSMHTNSCNSRLGSVEMRDLLSRNGTPQGAPSQGHIGIMPNLRRIAGRLVDVYLRDFPGDTGEVPSTGPLSSSPDVIVLPAPVLDPQGTFGEGSGSEDSSSLSQPVVAGSDHQVYVRVRNRGMCPAAGVTATVHWSEVSTLVTPESWTPIGVSPPTMVLSGDSLTVTPAIQWLAANIPAPGHYCFVATVDHPYDPSPQSPPSTDWNGFKSFLRGSNNVTWRNFNVIQPDSLLPEQGVWFWMNGAPDQARRFDFEIIPRLPPGSQLFLETPLSLAAALRGPFVRVRKEKERVEIALPLLVTNRLSAVKLGGDAGHKCRFFVRSERRRAEQLGSIVIRQLHEGAEVGRITWALRPRRARVAER